jgi:hypothetical protein
MSPDIGEQARQIGSGLEGRLDQPAQQVTDLVRAKVDFYRVSGAFPRVSIKMVVPERSSHVGSSR